MQDSADAITKMISAYNEDTDPDNIILRSV